MLRTPLCLTSSHPQQSQLLSTNNSNSWGCCNLHWVSLDPVTHRPENVYNTISLSVYLSYYQFRDEFGLWYLPEEAEEKAKLIIPILSGNSLLPQVKLDELLHYAGTRKTEDSADPTKQPISAGHWETSWYIPIFGQLYILLRAITEYLANAVPYALCFGFWNNTSLHNHIWNLLLTPSSLFFLGQTLNRYEHIWLH